MRCSPVRLSKSFKNAIVISTAYAVAKSSACAGTTWTSPRCNYTSASSAQAIKGGVLIGDVKTEAGRRDLPLLPAAAELLEAQAAQRRNEPGTDLIFTTRSDSPINPHNFLRSFNRIRVRLRPAAQHAHIPDTPQRHR